MTIEIRDAVTAAINEHIGELVETIRRLPNRYGDGNTIKRDDVLHQLSRRHVALLQAADAAILNTLKLGS